MILVSHISLLLENYRKKRNRTNFYKLYSNQFKRYLKIQGYDNTPQLGEEGYLNKWSVFGDKVEPFSYRFFCHYCGHTPNIIPEDIGHVQIESKLNPIKYRSCYQDKNLFPLIVGVENVAKTVICRINGSSLLDGGYNKIDVPIEDYFRDYQCLVLKPTVDSCSGLGVKFFKRGGDRFLDVNGGGYFRCQLSA